MYENTSQTFPVFQMVVILAFYLYFATCQYYIAKKVAHRSPWWAYIPLLNFYHMVELAGKQWYWFILFFIPVINIIAWVLIWVEIAKVRAKSPVWGVLMLIPFVNYIALTVLASGEGGPTETKTYQETPSMRQPVSTE
jgi:hypothetical protein